MLNIVVPMAGRGQRFIDAGYSLPKPLIPVHGVPMIELIIANLRPSTPHRFHFLIQRAHDTAYGLSQALQGWAPGCSITHVEGITEGAACTVLLARDKIDSEVPLMIANCDQWVDTNIDEYLSTMNVKTLDGLIMTMTACDSKWSYVRFDQSGDITEVVEKKIVSNEATVGIYNFRQGADFVCGADKMIDKNLRVNNEFYVAPVYNELITVGKRLGVFNIGAEDAGMYGLGIPEDLEKFIANPLSKSATANFGVER
jgi:NDP-sugar pyrophosphorylase family protein